MVKLYKNFNIQNIHKNEIRENGIEITAKSYETICNYMQSELKWWNDKVIQ